MDIPNLKLFGPSNPMKMAQMFMKAKGPNSPIQLNNLTIDFILKIKTNYKLNMILKDGTKLINNDDNVDDELHYVKFEGLFPNFELSPSALQS